MIGVWSDPAQLGLTYRKLQVDLAEILIQLAAATEDASARAGFLIRGFLLTTDLDGGWSTSFPEIEIQGANLSTGSEQLTLTVASAFRYCVDSGDYIAADRLARQRPEEFTTPGLRGWRAALTGLLDQDTAVRQFSAAAAEFAKDEPSEARRNAGLSWNSQNKDLWSKYFSARSRIAEIVTSPTRATELLADAENVLKDTQSGWIHPQVTCFRLILNVLSQLLLGTDADAAASQAKETLLQSRRLQGADENDELVIDFLDLVDTAFSEIRAEPATVILSTGVRDALAALGRIPLVGSSVASALSPIVAEQTFAGLFNQSQGWMYKTIESITDERTLQRLILRLMQGRLPLYAQIRQGPLEYGKDIAVLVEDNGAMVLQMYQVKAGNITVPVWRTARGELEEIFQVELTDVQLSTEPERREGILIFNGHLNPHVEEPVKGWLAEQRRDHSRTFLIMHLDLIINWIVRKGLINELRLGLDELGIPIVRLSQSAAIHFAKR